MFMFIKHRIRSTIILFLIWLSVPALYVYASLNDYADSFTLILFFMSTTFMIFGLIFYMGNAQIIAGFNSMSSNELKEYDMERVSVISGLCWFSMSLIVFHGAMLISVMIGEIVSVLFSIIVILTGMVIWSISISCKRFCKGEN